MTVLLKKGKKFVLEFWLNLAVIWMLDKIFFKKFILLLIVASRATDVGYGRSRRSELLLS